MYRSRHLAVMVVVFATAFLAFGQTRQEFHYKVRHRATISITNPYGPISVRPATNKEIAVTAFVHSSKVEVDPHQRGNRIDVISHLLPGADADSGRVDYELFVPADANVTLRSTTGPLRAEKLHGDVIMEGNTADVDVHDLSDGHVHIRTLNGPITITNVVGGHVEVTSVSGNVALRSVNGPFVQVSSTSGMISYDGNFGEGGVYSLMTHTGDILATAPSYASIEVVARSEQGKVENDFILDPPNRSFAARAGSAFAGTINKAASSVKLLSFSGKIHLKKR